MRSSGPPTRSLTLVCAVAVVVFTEDRYSIFRFSLCRATILPVGLILDTRKSATHGLI